MANNELNVRITGDLSSIIKSLRDLEKNLKDLQQQAVTAGTQAGRGMDRLKDGVTGVRDSSGTAAANVRNLGAAAQQAGNTGAAGAKKLNDELQRTQREAREAERAAARLAAQQERAAARQSQLEARNRERAASRESAQLAQVAPQLTDIFTQLASGSNPLLVGIQQGGQLRDIFGGIGPAITAVGGAIAGLVTPLTVAAGAVAALGLAWLKGQEEALRFNRTLILTGNTAGVTTDQMIELSRALDGLEGVTQRAAAGAINTVLESGRFAGEQIAIVARAAEQLRVSAGRDVATTVAEFAKIAGDPTAAVVELNRQYGFLNGSILEQIRTLQSQGREQEAATLAMKAYADTVSQRSPEVTENLGYIERAWRAVKKASGEAVDAALNIGRQDTGREQFNRLVEERERLQELQQSRFGGVLGDPASVRARRQARIDAINSELRALADAEANAQREANRTQAQAQAIQISEQLREEAKQYETREQRRARARIAAINRADEAIARARIAGDKATEENAKRSRDQIISALDREEQEDQQRRAEDARRKAEQQARLSAAERQSIAAVVGIDAGLVRDAADRSLKELDRLYGEGRVKLRDYFTEKARLETESIDASIRAAEAERDAADTLEGRRRAEAEIVRLQRERAEIGPRTAREQAAAERDLASALQDLQARYAELKGDSLAEERLALTRERDRLLEQFGGDPNSRALITNIFDLEAARLQVRQIRDEADRVLGNLRSGELGINTAVNAGTTPLVEGERELQDIRQRSIEQLIVLRDRLREVLEQNPGDTSTAAALREVEGAIGEITAKQNEFRNGVRNNLEQSLFGFFSDLATGAKSAKEAFLDLVRNFIQGLARMAAQALAQRAALAIFDAFTGGFGGKTGSMSVSKNHSGGMAGHGTKVQVPPWIFAGAPRFHNGGMVGLKPGEVPAILQTGERVLNRSETARYNAGDRPAPGIRLINVVDPSLVEQYMESSAGERVVLNTISRNPGAIRQILA